MVNNLWLELLGFAIQWNPFARFLLAPRWHSLCEVIPVAHLAPFWISLPTKRDTVQSNAEHLEVSTIINVNLQKILPVGYSQRREAFVILILEHIEHDGQPCSEYSTCGWDGHDCKVEEDGAQIYNERLSIDKKKLCQVS